MRSRSDDHVRNNQQMRILALVTLTVFFAALPALADDYGPRGAVRSARDASTELVRAYADQIEHRGSVAVAQRPLIVYDVVTDGNDAVASWTINDVYGIIVLHRRLGVWWRAAAPATTQANPTVWLEGGTGAFGCSAPGITAAPTMSSLTSLYGVSSDVATQAVAHNAILAQIAGGTTAGAKNAVNGASCLSRSGFDEVSTTDGYLSSFALKVAQAAPGTDIARFSVRAPTQGEFPPTPGANSYYFFSFELDGTGDVRVSSGSLDVSFPFVLDQGLRYSLTIGFTKPVLDPIRGHLINNTLHFDLPPFAATPGVSMMGEVEGDP